MSSLELLPCIIKRSLPFPFCPSSERNNDTWKGNGERGGGGGGGELARQEGTCACRQSNTYVHGHPESCLHILTNVQVATTHPFKLANEIDMSCYVASLVVVACRELMA